MGWFAAGLVVSIAVLFAAWGLLYSTARRLPSGLLRDVAGCMPDCVLLLWHLHRHPAVPRSVRVAGLVAVVWVLTPIDLVPGFVPLVGPHDEALVVALALRFAARAIPRAVVEDAWEGDPRILTLLIGPAPRAVVSVPRHA